MGQKKPFKMKHLIDYLGFTTIELVVSVGVLATMAAVSVPMISHYSPTYNTKQAASHIVSQMQLARIRAIKNRVTTVLTFYPEAFTPGGQAGSFMIFEDNNNSWVQDPGERVITPQTFMPSKVSLISAAFTSNGSGGTTDTTSCGFGSQGVAARIGAAYVIGNVQLKNSKNETRTISINASGRVKVSKP
jgi:Tfp pilus assembly protein FimT